MESYNDRIRKKYNTLSTKKQIIAQFILDHPNEIALKPVSQIGQMTDTSETTVIRLCYDLGYSGYSDLQEEIRQSLLKRQTGDPLKNYRKSTQNMDQTDFLIYTTKQDTSYIHGLSESIDRDFLLKIIRSIISAKQIIVVGFRSSYAPAYWLSYTLNIIRGDVHLYRGGIDDPNYLITKMRKDWLVIALSFPRYSQDTILFTQAAKEKKASILAITDDELSPIGKFADLLLKVNAPTPTAIKGMPTIFSVLNALVTGVATLDKRNTDKRLTEYEKSSNQYNTFGYK